MLSQILVIVLPKIERENKTAGFTLIELSIVLVIIGLIVGGVLVGQDLIHSAEIRATVTQIEKYNTAVNTFRGKYDAIPGDMPPASASQFGLYSLLYGGSGFGDGNGVIGGGAPSANGEGAVFWLHLSQAGLIDGSYGANISPTAGDGEMSGSGATIATFIPPAKLGRGNYIIASGIYDINYFGILGVTALGSTAYLTASSGGNLTPLEAYNIDKKTDDGLPQSGIIQAIKGTTLYLAMPGVAQVGDWGLFPPTDLATTNCATGTSPNQTYYLAGTYGSTQACSLRLQFN